MTFDAESLTTALDLRTLGERFYLKTLDQISPKGMADASLLPGWSRTHVAMHVVHNAEGFMRLLEWARTGVENPMYPSREERDREIEESVAHTGGEDAIAIAHEVVEELDEAFAAMGESDWSNRIVSGRGDDIVAAEIPWLRTREVFVHALDLGIGATALDFPAAVVDRLLDDIAPIWEKKGLSTHYELEFLDRDAGRTIRTGAATTEGGTPEPVVVAGEAAEVLSYLMGRGWPRSTADDRRKGIRGGTAHDLPAPPAWL